MFIKANWIVDNRVSYIGVNIWAEYKDSPFYLTEHYVDVFFRLYYCQILMSYLYPYLTNFIINYIFYVSVLFYSYTVAHHKDLGKG